MATTLTKRAPRALRPWFRRPPLANLREEMENLITHALGDDEEGWLFGRLSPPLDMSESNQALEVRMDLPGIDPKDIDIQATENMLTVSGQRAEEREQKGKISSAKVTVV